MKQRPYLDTTRRRLLHAVAAIPAVLYLPRIVAAPAFEPLRPTPECGDDTPAQTAGPFYTPDAPEKRDFRPDDPDGEALMLQGLVLDTGCRPQPGCIVELWYADSKGRYDSRGFRLRGYHPTDGSGAFRFRATVPGRYPSRTRHFHLRLLDGPGRRLLTTQLYFPDEPHNARDFLFRPELLMQLQRDGAGLVARYDFVVSARRS